MTSLKNAILSISLSIELLLASSILIMPHYTEGLRPEPSSSDLGLSPQGLGLDQNRREVPQNDAPGQSNHTVTGTGVPNRLDSVNPSADPEDPTTPNSASLEDVIYFYESGSDKSPEDEELTLTLATPERSPASNGNGQTPILLLDFLFLQNQRGNEVSTVLGQVQEGTMDLEDSGTGKMMTSLVPHHRQKRNKRPIRYRPNSVHVRRRAHHRGPSPSQKASRTPRWLPLAGGFPNY